MSTTSVNVREQQASDLASIAAINTAAFAAHGPVVGFDKFRAERDDIISLVAELEGDIVGQLRAKFGAC